jgi:tRNA pseudouridine(38-40) synthase
MTAPNSADGKSSPDRMFVRWRGSQKGPFLQLFNRDIDISGQGRTDAGVHAVGQTAHADLPDTMPPEKIIHAMKGLLPEDVSLVSVATRG